MRTVPVSDFGLYRALSEVVGAHLTAEALAGVTDLSWDEYRAEDLSPLLDLPSLTRLAWRPYTMYGRKPVPPAVLRRAEGVLATLSERGVSIERYQPAAP